MNEFWERVLFQINKQEMTQKVFCQKCDLALASFNKWKASPEPKVPRFEIVQKMAEVLKVDAVWLLTGEKSGDDPSVEILHRYPEIRELVLRLGECPENVGYLSAYLTGRLEALDECK